MLRYEHGGDIYGKGEILLDFSVSTNPLGLPESVRKALVEQVDDYSRYPDPRCRELAAALARYHGVPPSLVLCGNGASDLLFRFCAYLQPRTALTLAPGFSEYGRAVTLFGGAIREHRLREEQGFALTEEILSELTPDVQTLFLCNPNNPTGRLAAPELLAGIADACAARRILLVLDECFIDFTEGESLAPLLRRYPRLVIVRAFTKLYAMAGLRLGYLLCADPELLARIAAFGPAWNVSVAAQAAGLAALQVSGWAGRTRALIREERALMRQELARLGLTVYPSDANFLLVRSEKPLYGPLLDRGVLVRSCANFSGLDERYLRLGLQTRENNLKLLGFIAEVLDD